jgi:2-polyprenyl-3-methyl-5-hydroxy-6-metoxy-1,4-benzoquinol methylase
MNANHPQNEPASAWEQFFDNESSHYLEHGFTTNTMHEVAFLLDELQLEIGTSILDIGCGVGRHSIPLARHGYHVTGIDLSSGMLAQARSTALSEGVDVTFIHADASRYTSDREFDAAICLCEGAIGLVGANHDESDYDVQILTNAFNSLRPNSKFIITTMNGFRIIRQSNDNDIARGVFDPITMIETHAMVPLGATDSKEFSVRQRHYIPSEFCSMLRTIGFQILHIWKGTAGDWKREMFQLDDTEYMIVARKP